MSLASLFRNIKSGRGRKGVPPSVHCGPAFENPSRSSGKRYLIGASSFSLYNCDSSSSALSDEEQMSKLKAYLEKQYEKVVWPLAYIPDASPPFDLYEFYQTFLKEMIEKEASFEGDSKCVMIWSTFLCWWVMSPVNLHPAILDCMRTRRIEVSNEPTPFQMHMLPVLFCWFQAEEGFYNIHVHASSKDDRGVLHAISYAYLIRDCRGDVSYNNFGAFDCIDDGGDYVLFGELLAIKDSLQACLSMDMLSVKIYTDSLAAYTIFQGEDFSSESDLRVYVENRQTNLGEVVRAVMEMKELMTSCEVKLCEPSLNETAQLLSSYAYRVVRGRLSEGKRLEMIQAVGERVVMEKEKKGRFAFVFVRGKP